MEVEIGLRVVRGPDWEWGDQDGGEGHVGTVVEVGEQGSANGERSAVVQWDGGELSTYRCGLEGKYDLRVLDSGPAGVRHPGITCDECHQNSMSGIRWKCAQCHDFDLCTGCYMEGKHNCEHIFVRHAVPRQPSRMNPRKDSREVEVMGAFPGADVVRGKDWSLGDKDGGKGEVGKIIILSDVENESYRGVAEVEWSKTGLITTCRLGQDGNVDIQCVIPMAGGRCYIDHLPVLGAPNVPPGAEEFASGEVVQVELDKDVFMMLQQGHGGWNEKMTELKGKRGVIHHIKDNGDLLVVYSGNGFVINPAAVVKVYVKPAFKPGDVVRIMDDRAEVTKLQKGHGEWNEDMLDSLGQTGVVQQTDAVGDAHVLVKGRLWWYNSECLSSAAKESIEDSSQETVPGQDLIVGQDAAELRRRMELLKVIGDSDVLAHAALLGEEGVIKEYLDEYPNDVNAKFSNKTALHCAAAAGRPGVIKLLLEYQADIHAKDEIGLTPLHHCAIRNEKEAAVALLEAGADPNLQNDTGLSPIGAAIHKNSTDVLELLASNSKIDLCAPNHGGDTPLHIAVTEQSLPSVNVLLQAGADVTAVNFKLCTPMHVAAELGLTVLLEEFLRCHPEHINLKGSEIELSLLHFAAVRDSLEVADFLLNQPTCDTEARSSTLLTPFLFAVASGGLKVLERLVGHGVDITATDEDEDTALHLVIRNKTPDYKFPDDKSPEMKKVQGILGDNASPQAVLCCFLVYVGVDVNRANFDGSCPLDLCDPVLAVTIASFAEEHKGESKLHGSLKHAVNGDKVDIESPCNEYRHPQASSENHERAPKLSTATSQVETDSETGSCNKLNSTRSTCTAPEPLHSRHLQPAQENHHTLPNAMVSRTLTTHSSREETEPTEADTPSHANHVSQIFSGRTTSQLEECEEDVDGSSGSCNALATSAGQPVCILCDEPATVRLLPCGHEIICLVCSKRAKKCLQCKSIVTAKVNLLKLKGFV